MAEAKKATKKAAEVKEEAKVKEPKAEAPKSTASLILHFSCTAFHLSSQNRKKVHRLINKR